MNHTPPLTLFERVREAICLRDRVQMSPESVAAREAIRCPLERVPEAARPARGREWARDPGHGFELARGGRGRARDAGNGSVEGLPRGRGVRRPGVLPARAARL